MPAVLTFSDQIRTAIKTCGISRYEIAMRTGVAQSVLSRFMKGNRGLTTDTLDQLAAGLPMRVTIDALYAETPAGAFGKRVNYARTVANAGKLKVKK